MRTGFRLVALIVIAALASGQPVAGYNRTEILRILFAGIRSRDLAVQRAVLLLRQKKLLTGWCRSLPTLGGIAEEPDVMGALVLLGRKGILPDVNVSPTAISDYLGRLQELSEEERDKEEESAEPIVRYGEILQDAPFFVKLPQSEAYLLGGLAIKATVVEMSYQRKDGYVRVLLPNVSSAFVRRKFIAETKAPVTEMTQDPDDLEVRFKGALSFYQAYHKGASLSILKISLDPQFKYSLRPYVIPGFDQLRPGGGGRRPLEEIARSTGSLGCMNGSFFVMMERSPHDGKPLCPVIIDGRVAWSYREPRVLQMKRSYLCITSRNRAFVGDTDLTAEEILEAEARGEFAPRKLRGERIRHLLGGVGWLVRNGNSEAWRGYMGKQFKYDYYSLMVKRPQSIVAVSADGRTVWLMAQEGMPHSDKPLPLPELARYAKANFRCADAVFLDGGGSTQMVVHGQNSTRPENMGRYRLQSTALLAMGPDHITRTEPWPFLDDPEAPRSAAP